MKTGLIFTHIQTGLRISHRKTPPTPLTQTKRMCLKDSGAMIHTRPAYRTRFIKVVHSATVFKSCGRILVKRTLIPKWTTFCSITIYATVHRKHPIITQKKIPIRKFQKIPIHVTPILIITIRNKMMPSDRPLNLSHTLLIIFVYTGNKVQNTNPQTPNRPKMALPKRFPLMVPNPCKRTRLFIHRITYTHLMT